jgi:RHS repeat-associated protein
LQVSGSTQTTNFFLSDGLGSLLGVFSNTASSASLLASQLYYPYGASRYSSGTVSPYTTKGFTGQYNDPTSGLDYYGARYYDPVVGLFVSADKQLKKPIKRYKMNRITGLLRWWQELLAM